MDTVPAVLVGTWTYRSFISNPGLNADFDALEFGRGNLRIDPAPMQSLKGLIYGDGWQLTLKGSITYGNPFTARFQGVGMVGGAEWIYDYIGYLVRENGPMASISARHSWDRRPRSDLCAGRSEARITAPHGR